MPILHWLNDEQARETSNRVPYRLLEADATLSYGDPNSENMLIQGDNLEALKALLPYYAGQVKCIYIDPPYNTKSAFEHYDDNLEHSTWLSTLYPRLEILRDLLSENGSIWVSIDDNEGHYLKVIMDEIFGRQNFIANVIWQKKYAAKSDSKYLSESHDHILSYARNLDSLKIKQLPRTMEQNDRYKNPDNDPRGFWMSGDLLRNEARDYAIYEIIGPTGKKHLPPPGTSWRFNKDKYEELVADNRIWFGSKGNNVPRLKRFLNEVTDGVPATTLWGFKDVGHNDEAKKESVILFSEDVFGTPKPERLIQRVLTLTTEFGDLVLDSFLGSGTTAAVAHKMGRRYIGIEMGDHAVTHCVPRLKKVVDGEQGGISQEVNWQGGGGFHFYKLGEAIFNEEGQINPAVKFRALAAHVWFTETHTPLDLNLRGLKDLRGLKGTPLLGIHNGTAYYLLYNGILGDKAKDGGNVLTGKVLASLPPHQGPKVIYGELTTFGSQRLTRENIIFKQVPYDIKAR